MARRPGVDAGEEQTLFGDDWRIECLDLTEPASHEACFFMTRD